MSRTRVTGENIMCRLMVSEVRQLKIKWQLIDSTVPMFWCLYSGGGGGWWVAVRGGSERGEEV